MEIRLGPRALAIIVVGALGLFLLALANIVDAFALADSTPFVRVGWVIITIALVSFTVLMVVNLARSGPSQNHQRVE